jgi:hypothetical protein
MEISLRLLPTALVTLALAVFAGQASAKEVLECKFPKVGNNMGYLPDLVIMAREPGSDSVTVADAYIQSVKGGPIDVKVSEENSAKLSVSWPLMLQSQTNDYVKVQYRISIQKKSLSATLSGLPQGFSNNFSAQGKCKRLEG